MKRQNSLIAALNVPSSAGFRLSGTVRSRPFEETIARATEVMSAVGITRVANITGLDLFDLPVWQATRPLSRNLSVSQGKGLTHDAALASALMESLEMWHAENPIVDRSASVSQIIRELKYDLSDLLDVSVQELGDLCIDWKIAIDLADMSETWVPLSTVTVDFREDVFGLNFAGPNSTGLASGNCYGEACLHAIYECIERDAIPDTADISNTAGTQVPYEDLIDGSLNRPLQLARELGFGFKLETFRSLGDAPTFRALLLSPEGVTFCGAGTHLDTSIAVSRAIAECFQSRVTFISGARDDIEGTAYRNFSSGVASILSFGSAGQVSPIIRQRTCSDNLHSDLRQIVQSLETHGIAVLISDLSSPDLGIPVVFAKLVRRKV